MAEKTRIEHLREMAAGAETRMGDNCGHQNYAVLGRFRRDLLAEIETLAEEQKATSAPSELPEKVSVVSEFEKKLAARQSGPAGPRRRAN